jgi:hypothetical protein
MENANEEDRPFFVYVPFSHMHVPIVYSPKYSGKSGKGILGDALMELDDSVGIILQCLEATGQRNNTLILIVRSMPRLLSAETHHPSALRPPKYTPILGSKIFGMVVVPVCAQDLTTFHANPYLCTRRRRGTMGHHRTSATGEALSARFWASGKERDKREVRPGR